MCLEEHGWTLVSTDPDRYVGYYRSGGRTMEGGLRRTASGRRQFYVKQLTRRFWKNAHNGQCTLKRSDIVEGAFEVHFVEDREPDTFLDGIREIERLMMARGN